MHFRSANRGRYETSTSVAGRVRDNKRVTEALAAGPAAGANTVPGPNLSVADPEKANLGAYGTAYKAARAKADAYAAAANLRVMRVLAISDGGQGGYMPQMADMEARIAAPPTVVPQAAPPVMAGPTMNTVDVRGDFALAAMGSEEHTSRL